MLTAELPPLDLGPQHRGTHAVALLVGVTLVLLALAAGGRPVGAPAPAWRWLTQPAAGPTAIGPIALDGDLAPIVDRLGPPSEVGPGMGGTVETWRFDGGAVLWVTVDERSTVVGVELDVPTGSPVRAALDGGLVVGASRIDGVGRVWGPPDAVGTEGDDFALRYVTCIGPAPVVEKLGVPGSPRLGRALVAYADEAPGTSGCEWPGVTEEALG